MHKVKIIQETLKSILLDEIKGSKKLIKEAGEKIYWFQWDGGTRVVFNKK